MTDIPNERQNIVVDAETPPPTEVIYPPKSSFFDLGKARQTIYSILMGFVLKCFIEHVHTLWPGVTGLDYPYKGIYLLLLLYFLLNCFRFLFGLVDLSKMTDSDFAPTPGDWHLRKLIPNVLRFYVINTGIFQLIIFSFLAFSLFPRIDDLNDHGQQSLSGTITEAFQAIIITFIIWNAVLMLIDIICVILYLYLEKTENIDDNERTQSISWIFAGLFELCLCLFGYFAIKNPASLNFDMVYVVLIGLIVLNAFEIIGGYNYVGYYIKLKRNPTQNVIT